MTRIRARGGNTKLRALRLDTGNFAWGTEACTQRSRILDVVYNATSNELVRTKTLVKNCIVSIDATPFKGYFAKHYGLDLDAAKRKARAAAAKKGRKDDSAAAKKKSRKAKKDVPTIDVNKGSARLLRKRAYRLKNQCIEKALED